MFQENHDATVPGASTAPYRPHTVEILYTTAILLVMCVAVYLKFFDTWPR